ncbi:E3 ubiquitin-protein ligase XIAP-like [Scleropages formosus]|uniref:E3 ubiquitin-protein ligase XIAP n=1 Tax=Scleropages formosus TaxID=113540 RepID=A0A0P7VCT2_SCLFO|nr:E3 ubiquitin-protein ligase XIAP-like [Scleropages formosus]
MAGHSSDIEADNYSDWSGLETRLESFRHFPIVAQVSAERLARAGFYFTGEADRVRCFSCHQTVEGWHRGDAPVDRHRHVSPTCKYLSCVHGVRPASPMNSSLAYDEEAEDMEYRLRRGEVVDDTMYPVAPHMRSEDDRLRSFAGWPTSAPVTPRALAQAGFFYLDMEDRVQCFCCGGMLSEWSSGDDPWDEHEKYFRNCFFVLGHDVGNVPSSLPPEEPRERQPSTDSFEERLRSFTGVSHPIAPERLARAGFYSSGPPDRVTCFTCGGGLKNWQPEEDPWEEHAKHYPGCRFLLGEKGQEFVNRIQLGDPSGSGSVNEDPLEKLQKLQREKQCKICMDRDIAIVFIPCGHLATCNDCSQSLTKCPICCAVITQKIKAYIS